MKKTNRLRHHSNDVYQHMSYSQKAHPMTEPVHNRPEFRNINAFADLPSYRLPAAGWVSILHRISGALMFLLLPFIIWLFDKSISSEISFAKFKAAFNVGVGDLPRLVHQLGDFGPDLGLFAPFDCGFAPFVHGRDPQRRQSLQPQQCCLHLGTQPGFDCAVGCQVV
jgi:hypothetical protein